MKQSTLETKPKVINLPSDQDASGRTLGEEEIALVADAIRSGTLTSTKGKYVKRLEDDFAALYGVKHCHAAASGSAALHCAIAAINPEPGDEIITTSITDMGALTPMIYQGAIPVFADVDPKTYNVTAETIADRISDRTKAIMVTHLFGNPCDMDPIMELARKHGIKVIEDCAQAFLTEYKGRKVGTIGDIGCFSMQQGKHITTGEGGLVISNDDELARRVYLFVNKAWGYGDPKPDHYFAALNYRLTELQGAVAVAQLAKLEGVVESRVSRADELTRQLIGLPGIETPEILPGCTHTYWKYCVNVDPAVIKGGTVALGAFIRERGIACAPRYIQKPAYCCQVFSEQVTFGDSRWPFTLARPEAVDYADENFQGTLQALAHVLVLPWNEKYESYHVDFIAEAIRDGVEQLAK
jgi:perosamine synthetase